MVVPFKNEPGIDFSVQENVERFQKTLEQVKNELGQTLPIVIDGEHITKDDTFDSINPANTSELIAKVSKATKEDVDKAFESSNKAYKAWRQWSHKDRAELLLRVAAIIRRRKRKSLQSWYMKQVNLGMRLLAMQQKVSTLSNTMHVQ